MMLAATKNATEVLLWAGCLIVLAIGAGLVILALRRAMLSKDGGSAEAGLFESLRAMRDSGAISREEYDAAKRNMVAKAAGQMGAPTPAVESKPKATIRTPDGGVGEVRAKPGFDLTGRPLPKSDNRPGNT